MQSSMRPYCIFLLLAGCAATQVADRGPFDLLDLPRMKTFSAERVSSGNRYVGSNDDSKRVMPGETYVMADLSGPGVVSHIWLTVADNEFAWPRLVRLRRAWTSPWAISSASDTGTSATSNPWLSAIVRSEEPGIVTGPCRFASPARSP